MTALVLLSIGLAAQRYSRRWSWPPVVLALVLAAVFTALSLWNTEVNSVGVETRALVVAGLLAFTLGGGAGRHEARRRPRRSAAPAPAVKLDLVVALLVVLGAIFLSVLPKLASIHRKAELDNLVATVNAASREGELDFGIHLWVFRSFLALTLLTVVRLAHDRSNRRLRATVIGSTAFALLASLAFANRGLSLMVIGGIGLSACFSGLLSIKKVVIAGAGVFLLIFFGFAALRGHFQGDAAGLIDTVLVRSVVRNYAVGSVAAFEHVVASRPSLEMGLNTLRSLCLWLGHFGVHLPVVPMVQEMVYVPFGVNVFTALDPYYRDFGILGIVLFAAIDGCVTCFFFEMAHRRRSSVVHVGMAALLFAPTLMFFFTEQYFSQISNWIFIGGALWLCESLLTRKAEQSPAERRAHLTRFEARHA